MAISTNTTFLIPETNDLDMKLPNFKSKAFLAPMAGVTDPALRLVCKELGAGLVVTELTSIHAVVARKRIDKDIRKFVEFSEKERPLSVQLFGSDLEQLKKAVNIVSPFFDIIDYNMGCPSPHITEQMAGAALLQEEELTRKIFQTLVQNSVKPVTLKMRSGVNKPNCFKKIAQIAEEEGISMITLHPRTVKQGYSGEADWSLIKKLKESVTIPVVGNGDIQNPEDAKRMLDKTDCNYVMIGRAAAKNPFVFTQINQFLQTEKYEEVGFEQRLNCFFRYLKYTENYPTIRFANIKMMAMNFTKGIQGGKKLREKLMRTKNVEEIKRLFQSLLHLAP